MNKSLLYIVSILLICSSCSSEYSEENLIEDLLNNNSKGVINNFYKPGRLEKIDLAKIIDAYSFAINDRNLEKVKFSDKFSFKKRPRKGYFFIDDNNNFQYSITYKYTTLENGKKLINFIDFRSANEDLPCLKFPSKFPIKCADLPNSLPLSIDSLKLEFPKQLAGQTIYHEQIATKEYLLEHEDRLKPIIAFNLGNGLISKNLEEIISELNSEISLDSFSLSSWNDYGESTINLHYSEESFNKKIVNNIANSLAKTTRAEVKIHPISKRGYKINPRISIGGVNSQGQVRVCNPFMFR